MVNLSANAETVLAKRYYTRDEQGAINEDGEAMFRRVAGTLADVDRQYGADTEAVEATAQKFYNLMASLDFLPNSPTLANAGARTGQLSACYVLPVADDLRGIFEAIRDAALIHQTGGGTGFSFSRLRPRADRVGGNHGVSSGPVSFMDVFNAATESIKQGGQRRGANMGILRIDHPDIMEFIGHKQDLSKLTNFNISVAVTDDFMAAVEAGTDFALVNPRTGAEVGRLDAREVFRTIVERAWSTGEPGVVFIDRMNDYCPVPWLGHYEATNPCGEQPLIPYESCNLGSINLENFVTETWSKPLDPNAFRVTDGPRVDWPRLRTAIHSAVHLLDNVIDANCYPIDETRTVALATRKIGLGVMGFARMLFKMGVAYGGNTSLALAGELMSFIDYESKIASVSLARQRGVFPARKRHESESNRIYQRWCDERQSHPDRHPEADYDLLAHLISQYGLRNSTTTTIAPTGTLSIIANTSGGCEPVFGLAFKRWQADTHMLDSDPIFEDSLRRTLPNAADEVLAGVEAAHGSLAEYIASLDPADRTAGRLVMLAATFRTAHDISPAEHVLIQSAFQAFNDSATSKTINFAESATVEDVETAYRLAYETGCKGITVYRNNSRQFQPLSVGDKPAAEVLAVVPMAKPEGCPECGGTVQQSEGCESCACGWSACSVA